MKKLLTALLLVSFVFPSVTVVAEEGQTPVETIVATTTPATLEETVSTTTEPVVQEDIATTTEEATSIEAAPLEIETPIETEEILVKFKDSVDVEDVVSDTADSADASVSDILTTANSAIVSVESADIESVVDLLSADPTVEYAERNQDRAAFSIPTDDNYKDLMWALENTGQTVDGVAGTAGDDIDALSAWNLSLGTSSVVAVIDSGVQYNHPDLLANMWDGTSCVDDLGGVLGNCLHGYDFADNDLNPLPVTASTSFAHGTHVAGTIAARKNNTAGTIGVAPSAKVMAIRFGFDVFSEVRAIDFATANGVKIINASFGGAGYSPSEYQAIERFTNAGGIFIAAAGNDGNSAPVYPAAYDLPGIVSVAATDQSDGLASFSDYSDTTVDLAAPGVNIASTYTSTSTPSTYGFADGTSMAAPHVAGVAALIRSLYPSSTAAQIKSAILDSGNVRKSLHGKTVTGKRLDAYRALQIAGGTSLDTQAPVITLLGSSVMTLTVGDIYSEPGATTTDNVNATTTIVVSGDAVDTATPGTYHVAYDTTDSSDNQAAQVIRTVTVNAAPVVSSGGGGGGGGGSSKSSKKKSVSVKKTTVTKVVANPARPALTTTKAATPTVATPAVAAAPTFQFVRALSLGMSDPDVTALQEALTRAGVYAGPITGYFGPMTQAGVSAYQVKHALPAVGMVGPMTRALLNTGA